MKGMNHTTGHAVADVAHLCQSIAEILTTPRGSRLMRRNFGSDLYLLVDAPLNPATRVRAFAAAATALMQWEPRLKVTRIGLVIDTATPGAAALEIEGTTTISRDQVSTIVPLAIGATAA